MSRISKYFKLNKSQIELDFVDVELFGDNLLFVDPFAISQLHNPMSEKCQNTIAEFFDSLVKAIRASQKLEVIELLAHLHEPNETRLGYSRKEPRGNGIGEDQGRAIFRAVTGSEAMITGFITSLPECVLMIPRVAGDKISDITTNVIRAYLIEYTARQCELHDIPIRAYPSLSTFNRRKSKWENRPYDIPVVKGRALLLVPRVFVKSSPAYDAGKYYQHHVLNCLQAENLSRHTRLVRTLNDGRQVVYKKELKARHPYSKKFLYDFSRKHPRVLQNYRAERKAAEIMKPERLVSIKKEIQTARTLKRKLMNIHTGPDSAPEYHSLMVGLLVFLFHPNLLNPGKEYESRTGRIRIDILMENGARMGIFSLLHKIHHVPCRFVAFECQNYGPDVPNPSIRHLTDRFSTHQKVGFLCCRGFKNRALLIKKCHETVANRKGLIVPLDDGFFISALAAVEGADRNNIDNILTEAVNEVVFS